MAKLRISALSRDMLSGATVAILDQAILSATNLAIGLLFIRLTTKADYGIYGQLFTAMLLAQSLHSAFVAGPLVTLGAKRRPRAMRALAAHLFRLQTVVSLVLAVLVFTGLQIAAFNIDIPALHSGLAFAFAVALAGLWLREYVREVHFVYLKPHRTLLVDLVYVSTVATGLLCVSLMGAFSSATVFASVAVGNLLAGLWGLRQCGIRPLDNHGRGGKPLRQSWELSRWSLPGVGVTWASNYSFPYIVALIIGTTAVADVFASRLLLMPAGLCVTAWVSVFLPRASRWVGAGDFDTLAKAAGFSVLGLWGLLGTYFAVLMLVYGPLEHYVLGQEYAGLEWMAAAWAGFFAANAVRQAGTLSLVAGGYYKQLLWYSVIAIVLSMPVIIGLTYSMGPIGPILGLICSELLIAAIAWLHGWPMLKRRWQVAKPA